LVAGIFFAAASGGSSVSNKPSGGSGSSGSSSSGGSTTTVALAHVGSTISLSGVDLTLNQVIDPAQGADEFTTPDSGKRFVGVQMTLKNTGDSTLTGDANNEVSIIGSDNQTYTPDFNSISECTNFNDGSYTLAKTESTTGCVTFQVPTGVSVAKVRYEPLSFTSSNVAEWIVP
jgi:Domain of unknown function (DUF4352)